ncbi:uncharacterized protein BYT42DRAFT_543304 [Radiomyces spectabilis]|uniref:uncharacterized protein n=1 Tax=Radiomyces spectabilis TaxID=64574 RepID=UPI00221FB47C|nr:uncharacterized protein BYT42DRAFT_543304 [Radiomyces spectabilis]KAI8391811.1 hypothetical protein BYT42DRAFT_543304 [Radiomyces spectabilis]
MLINDVFKISPSNLKDVENFLGAAAAACVSQKLICNIQVLAKPLRRLKNKDTTFLSTEEQENAHQLLIATVGTAPVTSPTGFYEKSRISLRCRYDSRYRSYSVSATIKTNPNSLAFASGALSTPNNKHFISELEAFAKV